MTITTPPPSLPSSTPASPTDAHAVELVPLRSPSLPGASRTPGAPQDGATTPRRLSSDLGLHSRRASDPGQGRPGGGALAPRQSLDRLRTTPPALTLATPQTGLNTPAGAATTPHAGTTASEPSPVTTPRAETPASPTTSTATPVVTSPTERHSTASLPLPTPNPRPNPSLDGSGRDLEAHPFEAIATPVGRQAQEAAPARQGPPEAGALAFFAMQNVRHAGPVAAVRTVVQGVIAPEVARAVASHPDAALAVQTALTAWSVGRRIVSQIHSEGSAAVANQAFAGDAAAAGNSLPRRIWQGVQSAGILGGDFAAMGLTIAARHQPALAGVAQAAAALQVVSHLQAQFREALRPGINTVHVGNPHIAAPPEGRNLRPADVTTGMRTTFGVAAAGIDMAAQMLIKRTLGGQAAWQVSRGLAVGAGAIAGAANMLTSSVEDHLVDTASARRMQQSDPSHVRHLHFDMRNPFTRGELGRQAERADARIFNTLVPGLIAIGLMEALRPALSKSDVNDPGRQAAESGVHAAVVGLMGGALLALTVASYQLNDTVRSHNARQRSQAQSRA